MAVEQRVKGWTVPPALLTPTTTVLDLGGLPYLWDPSTGLLCSLEAVCERVDESFTP